MTTLPQGIHDLTDNQYHGMADHMSATGIKRLLPVFDGCPAKFRYFQTHEQPEKEAWTFGKLAHRLVLGEGPTIHVLTHDSLRSNAAKAEKCEAEMKGLLVVKQKDLDTAEQMAEQLQRHPLAVKALMGEREKALIWTDPETGILCRAKPDAMNPAAGILGDFKTTTCAATDKCVKAINDYGYWVQPAHYGEGAKQIGVIESPRFFFVFQEKEAPYLVNVIEPDAEMIAAGEAVAARARRIYAECLASNNWPGYNEGVAEASLRDWVIRKSEEGN